MNLQDRRLLEKSRVVLLCRACFTDTQIQRVEVSVRTIGQSADVPLGANDRKHFFLANHAHFMRVVEFAFLLDLRASSL